MLTLLAVYPGATVAQDSAVEIGIEGVKDFPPESTVFFFKQLFPAPLELVAVVKNDPIKRCVFGMPPSVTELLLPGCFPCSVHMEDLER